MLSKERLLKGKDEGLIGIKFSTCLRRDGTTVIRGSSGFLGAEGPMMTDLRVGIGAFTAALNTGNLTELGI